MLIKGEGGSLNSSKRSILNHDSRQGAGCGVADDSQSELSIAAVGKLRRGRFDCSGWTLTTFSLLAFAMPAVADDEDDYQFERKWQESFSFAASELSGNRLVVDNVIGGITVSRHEASRVEVTIDARWRADDEEAFDQAEQDMEMIVEETGYGVLVFFESAFRDRSRRYQNRSRDYRFDYAIDVKLPADFDLELSTVTGGDLIVDGVEGEMELETVTGDIVVTDLAAEASAETVSGDILLRFSAEPDLTIKWQSQFGELRTDLDFQQVPAATDVVVEQIGQLTRYERSSHSQIQFGAGRTRLQLKTLSGDITVREVAER